MLRDFDERGALPAELARARTRLGSTIAELWGSNEVRAVQPTVLDELHAGLIHFRSTIVQTIPLIYRDLEEAIDEAYPGAGITVPSFLTFGTWVGGDRDGNPNVTPELTKRRCESSTPPRSTCSTPGCWSSLVGSRSRPMSPGMRRCWTGSWTDYGEMFPDLAADLRHRNADELYRQAVTLMRERVRAARRDQPHGYQRASELLADLRVVAESLRAQGERHVLGGDLHDVIRHVETFGFHLAAMDIRDHASRHEATIAELFRMWGISEDYAALPEAQKCALLEREINDPRPIIPRLTDRFQAVTQEVIATFLLIRDQIREGDPAALGSYVISAAETPSDVLEVLLLMKESDLAEAGGGGRGDADRAAVREPFVALRCNRDHGAIDRLRSLSRRARVVGRRAGGNDRILGLEQGDRIPGIDLGTLRRADEADRAVRPAGHPWDLLPRSRRLDRPRRRADQ